MMKALVAIVFLMSGWVCGFGQAVAKPAPVDAERMMIYREFLRNYSEGQSLHLNIGNSTFAMTEEVFDESDCLKSFSKSDLKGTEVHSFADDAFPGNKIVDPDHQKKQDPGEAIRKGQSVDRAVREGFRAALFQFSEIVFDESHTHALFKYSFVCGRLCGHGGTLVFEHTKKGWVDSRKNCGSWIS